MPIDDSAFRELMASFPAGVVVVTAFDTEGSPRGLTVSAFCAVSLEPHLVLVCIDRSSMTLPAMQSSGGFTVNILAAGRQDLAQRMATKSDSKFAGVQWTNPRHDGAGPLLEKDASAWVECTTQQSFEAGDHWVFIGRVEHGEVRDGVAPLVYSHRTYFDL